MDKTDMDKTDMETDCSETNVLTLHTKNMILLGGKHERKKYRSKRKRTKDKLKYLFGGKNIYNLTNNGGAVSADLLKSIRILQSAQSSEYSLPNPNKSLLSKIVVIDNSSDDDDFRNNLVLYLKESNEGNTIPSPHAKNTIHEKSNLSNIYKEHTNKLVTPRMEDSDKCKNYKCSSNKLIIDTENIKPNNNIKHVDNPEYTGNAKYKNQKYVEDDSNYSLLPNLGYKEPMNYNINSENTNIKHNSDLSENETTNLDNDLISDSISVPKNKEQGFIVHDDDNSNDLVIDLNHNETNVSVNSESDNMKHQTCLLENETTNLDNVLISDSVSVPENKEQGLIVRDDDNSNDLVIDLNHNETNVSVNSESDNMKHQTCQLKNESTNLNNFLISDSVSVPKNKVINYFFHDDDNSNDLEIDLYHNETNASINSESDNMKHQSDLTENEPTNLDNVLISNSVSVPENKVINDYIYDDDDSNELVIDLKHNETNASINLESENKKHQSDLSENESTNLDNVASVPENDLINDDETTSLCNTKYKHFECNSGTFGSNKIESNNLDKVNNNDLLSNNLVFTQYNNETDNKINDNVSEVTKTVFEPKILYTNEQFDKPKLIIPNKYEANLNDYETCKLQTELSHSNEDEIVDCVYTKPENGDNETNKLKKASVTHSDESNNNLSATIDTTKPVYNNDIFNDIDSINDLLNDFDYNELIDFGNDTNHDVDKQVSEIPYTDTNVQLNNTNELIVELNQLMQTEVPDVIKGHILNENFNRKNSNNINTNLIQDINDDKISNKNSLNEHLVLSETLIPFQVNSQSPNENVYTTKTPTNTDCTNIIPENETKDKTKNQYPRTKITPRRQISKFPGKMDSMSKRLYDKSKVVPHYDVSYPETRGEHRGNDNNEEPINKIRKLSENIAVILHEYVIYRDKLMNSQGLSDIIVQRAMEQYYRVKRCCFEMSYPFVKSYLLSIGRETRFRFEFLKVTRSISEAMQIFTIFPDELFFEIWNELLDSAEKWTSPSEETSVSSIISSTLNFNNLTGYCSKSNEVRKDVTEHRDMPLLQNALCNQSSVAQSGTSSSTSRSTNTLKEYLTSLLKNTTQPSETPSNLAKPFLFEAGPPGQKIRLRYNPPNNLQNKTKEKTTKRRRVNQNSDTLSPKKKKHYKAINTSAMDLSFSNNSTAVQHSNSKYVQQTATTLNNSKNYNHRNVEMPASTAAGMATYNYFRGVGVPHVTAHSQTSPSLTRPVNAYPYNLSRNAPQPNQATQARNHSLCPIQNLNNTRWSVRRDSQYLTNQTQCYRDDNMNWNCTNDDELLEVLDHHLSIQLVNSNELLCAYSFDSSEVQTL